MRTAVTGKLLPEEAAELSVDGFSTVIGFRSLHQLLQHLAYLLDKAIENSLKDRPAVVKVIVKLGGLAAKLTDRSS